MVSVYQPVLGSVWCQYTNIRGILKIVVEFFIELFYKNYVIEVANLETA